MKPPIKIIRLNDIIPKLTKPSVMDKKVEAEFDKWVLSIWQAFVDFQDLIETVRAENKEAIDAMKRENQELRRTLHAKNDRRKS